MRSRFESLVESLISSKELPPEEELVELSDLDQDQVKHLAKNWGGISVNLRRTLVEELGKQADANISLSFEQINRLGLDDADEQVRERSILNLWESEDPSLVEPIINRLTSDPSEKVRAAAASALGPFVLIGETQGLPREKLVDIENALLEIHSSSKDEHVHCKCLESLGYSSREEVNDLIIRAFNSGKETHIRSAILAMGRSANKQWKDFVLTHLRSPSPVLRLESVVAVGELELKEALPEIVELVEDVDDRIRHASIWSLSQLGGSRAADTLAELYNQVEDGDELQLIEDAFDNLAFVDGTRDMLLFDYDDEEDLFN